MRRLPLQTEEPVSLVSDSGQIEGDTTLTLKPDLEAGGQLYHSLRRDPSSIKCKTIVIMVTLHLFVKRSATKSVEYTLDLIFFSRALWLAESLVL